MTTKAEFTAAARAFVANFVKTGRQWDIRTLESYLPNDLRFRDDADYSGPVTVSAIAAFMRAEAR